MIGEVYAYDLVEHKRIYWQPFKILEEVGRSPCAIFWMIGIRKKMDEFDIDINDKRMGFGCQTQSLQGFQEPPPHLTRVPACW